MDGFYNKKNFLCIATYSNRDELYVLIEMKLPFCHLLQYFNGKTGGPKNITEKIKKKRKKTVTVSVISFAKRKKTLSKFVIEELCTNK